VSTAVDTATCSRCGAETTAIWMPDEVCSTCVSTIVEATPAATAPDTTPKVDTTVVATGGRSTSSGVASMCLSGSHGICRAVHCSCHCHGGTGRSEVA
jgi:hypothetical protein